MSKPTYAVEWLANDGTEYRETFDEFFDAETYYVAIEQDKRAVSAAFIEVAETSRTLTSFSLGGDAVADAIITKILAEAKNAGTN